MIAAAREHNAEYGYEYILKEEYRGRGYDNIDNLPKMWKRDVDGGPLQEFQVTYDGTTYRSFAAERVDLKRYKVYMHTDPDWEKESTDLSMLKATLAYLKRTR